MIILISWLEILTVVASAWGRLALPVVTAVETGAGSVEFFFN